MKIKKINRKKESLISYNLLNLKYYLNFQNFSESKYNSNLSYLNSLETSLKKILKVIFNFHTLNKKIVFVGFPLHKLYKFSSLFKRFNYIFLNKNVWVNGMLSNPNRLSPYVNSRRFLNFYQKENVVFLRKFNKMLILNKKPDLLIVFNKFENELILKEANITKIPNFSLIGGVLNKKSILNDLPTFSHVYVEKLLIKFIYTLFSVILFRHLKKSIK